MSTRFVRLCPALFVLVLLCPARVTLAQPDARTLDAIRTVESGGRCNTPDGDGGRALGVYQIHREYWQDACRFDPSLRRRGYEACRTDAAYSRRVVVAYLTHYAGKHATPGTYARVHNGGPAGARKRATLPYLRRFLRAYDPAR